MKKAKKYLGRKILVKIETGNERTDYQKEFNIIRSLEDFKNDCENEMYTSIELLEDNIELYRCDIRKTNDLGALYEIRKYWAKGSFDYREFLTKQEIIKKLENDYCVAVEGLQEIELEDAKELGQYTIYDEI